MERRCIDQSKHQFKSPSKGRLTWLCPWVLMVLLSSLPLWAERPAISQETPVSLQFVSKLFVLLREVSPEQADSDKDFERELRQLLVKAKSLQADYHKAEQGGMRQQPKKAVLRRDGAKIVDEALLRTETYLEQVLKNLQQHRGAIREKLLPAK